LKSALNPEHQGQGRASLNRGTIFSVGGLLDGDRHGRADTAMAEVDASRCKKRGCLRFRQTPLLDYVRSTPCAMSALPSKAQALDVQIGVRRIVHGVETYIDFNHGSVGRPFVPFEVRGAVPIPVEFERGAPIPDLVSVAVEQGDTVLVLRAHVVFDAHVDREMGEVVYSDHQGVAALP